MTRKHPDWQHSVQRLVSLLAELSFGNESGQEVHADEAFKCLAELTALIRRSRAAVYFVGNGASASMASHYAADFAKNGHLHTQVFSDLALITAVANDLDYSRVFAEPLRQRGNAGDMLVAISSSGESSNILKAVDVARERGMKVVTLSAMSPANPLRRMGDLNAYVAADCYGDAETCHASILHHWMDLIEVK